MLVGGPPFRKEYLPAHLSFPTGFGLQAVARLTAKSKTNGEVPMKVCKRNPVLLFIVLCVSMAGSVQAQSGPFPLSEVPDANTGFRHPLSVAEVTPGWKFA